MSYARVPSQVDDDDDAMSSPPASASSASPAAPASSSAPAPAPATATATAPAAAPAQAFSLARALSSIVSPSASPPTAAAQARAFSDALLARFGAALVPALEPTGFEQALQRGARESRAVLVYLHSDLHGDTAEFLRCAFCTAPLRDALRDGNALCWAGSVHAPDGLAAAAQLQVAGFPFLGVYTGDPGGGGGGSGRRAQYQQLWTHEGLTTAAALAAELMRVTAATRARLEAARQLARARDAEREMAAEQDRSYADAMQRDVELEREHQQAQRREAEARRAAAAEKARVDEETALAEAIELSRALDVEGSVGVSRGRLSANPEPDSSAPRDAVSVLRLTLPSGVKVQRRFRATDTLSLVRDFVIVSAAETGVKLAADSFEVASSFPKRVFSDSDAQTPLRDLSLCPQAVLFVTVR